MARTYEAALAHLASLQSNKAVTSLFSAPSPAAAAPAPAPGDAAAAAPQDLNALAIPEMLGWLARAGLSPDALTTLRCVHVAGTKGKGSVCAYLTAVLTQPAVRGAAAVGRVGTYTSPHLVSVRERIQLDGAPLACDLFARYFFEVWDALTAAARADARAAGRPVDVDAALEAELGGPATKPFYFRFLTLLAFHVFLREGVRTAVVECGIGGEYDGTNVLPAAAVTASVVTQLGIDHVGMLGATLPEIAWHKAGVAKPGRRCFTRALTGPAGADAMAVLRRRAHERGAELVELQDAAVEAWGGVAADAAGGLEGRFQKYNQALAVAAAKEHLRVLGAEPGTSSPDDLQELPDGFADGLRRARLRGRCETVEEARTTWLIDGAHTAESLSEVAAWFATKRAANPDARHVLIFNQQDRDAAGLLESFYAALQSATGVSEGLLFDEAILTRNELSERTNDEPERDLVVQRGVAERFQKLAPQSTISVHDNVASAVRQARQQGVTDVQEENKNLVLVTGSLHLVGALLRTLEPDAPL